jgi:predicted phosphate transport protein (TIGR00153 family)
MSPKSHIFSMFGTSPIRPMQQHMAKVHACAVELIPFLEALLAADWEKAAAIERQIVALEGEADEMKRHLRMNLPSGLWMAMPRRDLLDALKLQDSIANKTKTIAGMMIGRRMQFPDELGAQLLQLGKRCIDACAQAQTAIDELDELVETSFRGREVDLVQAMIIKLDAIEADTDQLQLQTRNTLFALESSLPPVDVMFMYKVIDGLGDLANYAQRVGYQLELMLAR